MSAPATTERRLDWPQLLDEALTVEGSLGNVYNRFYPYSYLNQLLLRMQGVHEPVATYKRWQAIGRQVLKGSHAKEILRPITVKREDDDGTEHAFTKFKLVKCLFTVSETDGDELPAVELPGWDVDTALTALDIKQVPFTELDGNMQGYSAGREIAISPLAVYPYKTLMHELGHVVLGHTSPTQIHEYGAHRGVKEFQAESTAYLTLNELEQMPEDAAATSRAYIQLWLHEQRPPDSAIRPVFAAIDQILKAGRPPREVAAGTN